MRLVPDTQRASWEDIRGNLTDRRFQVLLIIREAKTGIALWEIAERLRWPINCVSGRVTELRHIGAIRDVGRAVNPHSGKKTILWAIAQFDDRGQGWLL